jgi:hypothetical protein
MNTRGRVLWGTLTVAGMTALGLLLGSVRATPAAGAELCPKKLCNTTTGACVETDVQYSCAVGPFGGCSSSACAN